MSRGSAKVFSGEGRVIKHVQVRLEDREFEVFSAKMKAGNLKSVQEAGRLAFLEWATDIPSGASPSKDEQVLVSKLITLLRSADEGRIDTVKHALDAHVQQERAKRKRAG